MPLLWSVVALMAGLGGATGAFCLKRRMASVRLSTDKSDGPWTHSGMCVTFRAELMPGRQALERRFRVARLLTNDHVTLEGLAGEHAKEEFEPVASKGRAR